MKLPSLHRILIVLAIVAFGFGVTFFLWWQREITVFHRITSENLGPLSAITGEPCERANTRPVAIMLANDPVARPLAGIAKADLVVEMPVTPGPNSVTRIMAIYQCREPSELGSVRSAREPFIPLAAAFDALYAHWGGEHDVLDKLNASIVNNINALAYEGTTFYRKTKIPRPHNGFTTLELLADRAKKLGYRLTTAFTGYEHRALNPPRNLTNVATTISVPYDTPYDVRWEYDQSQGMYKRWRGGTPEIDGSTGQQVTTKTVIVVQTIAQPLRDQYLDLAVIGQGSGSLYTSGVKTNIIWKKDAQPLGAKLQFLDGKGAPVPLGIGTLWIEYVL